MCCLMAIGGGVNVQLEDRQAYYIYITWHARAGGYNIMATQALCSEKLTDCKSKLYNSNGKLYQQKINVSLILSTTNSTVLSGHYCEGVHLISYRQ